MRLSIDRVPIKRNRLLPIFYYPKPEFFVLDLKVHYSKPMRLTFCHGLPTLQTQNLTIWLMVDE